MKFVELLHRDMDKLAEALSREHGKTLPDAKGDVIRGLEVAEFCFAAPQMMKGEYTGNAGPGIDIYSVRQPLGVVAGITPFNFPAMIPMWKFCRSEEHTSELQSLMRISYAVFCLKKKNNKGQKKNILRI